MTKKPKIFSLRNIKKLVGLYKPREQNQSHDIHDIKAVKKRNQENEKVQVADV